MTALTFTATFTHNGAVWTETRLSALDVTETAKEIERQGGIARIVPECKMRPSELAKIQRKNPRNFRAMLPGVAMALAEMTLGRPFNGPEPAIEALSKLALPVQHALDKLAAQKFAAQRGWIDGSQVR